MPDCRDYDESYGCGHIDENRILTILLDNNNKIVTYSGLFYYPVEKPKEIEYGKNGIRKELIRKNKIVHEYSANIGKPNNGLIVIIKPSKNSNYGNLVDILDEMKITGIKSYSILDEFTPEETKLLASK